jgi:hypothetical protein
VPQEFYGLVAKAEQVLGHFSRYDIECCDELARHADWFNGALRKFAALIEHCREMQPQWGRERTRSVFFGTIRAKGNLRLEHGR